MQTYMKGKKKKERIEILKKEFKSNNDVFKRNEEMLKMKAKAISDEEIRFNLSERKYNLSKVLLEIEVKSCKIVNPMLEFHNNEIWQENFREMKKLEIEVNEDLWKNIQQDHENRIKLLNERINETLIQEQFGRISERNPEIIKEFKSLGVEEEQEEKAEYIG